MSLGGLCFEISSGGCWVLEHAALCCNEKKVGSYVVSEEVRSGSA